MTPEEQKKDALEKSKALSPEYQNWIVKGDTKFVESWMTQANESKETIMKIIEDKMAEMKMQFPEDVIEYTRLRVLRVTKSHFRSQMASTATVFEGVMVGATDVRDGWGFARKQHIDKLREYVKQGQPQLAVEKGFVKFEQGIDVKAININNVEEYIAEYNDENIPFDKKRMKVMYPMYKKDGTPSKMAGKPIRPVKEALAQTLFGFGSPKGVDDPKGIILQLNGEACTEDNSFLGKPVTFRGRVTSTKESPVYEMNSTNTKFVEVANSVVAEVLKTNDLPVLVEQFLANYCVRQKDILEWESKEEIPMAYRNFFIIKDALLSYQNRTPSEGKSNVRLVIEEEDQPLDTASTTNVFIDFEEALKFDFCEGSKVMVVGRGFLGKPREGREDEGIRMVVMADKVLPYADAKIKKVDVPDIDGDDVVMADKKPNASARQNELNEMFG